MHRPAEDRRHDVGMRSVAARTEAITLQFHPDWPHRGRKVIESMAADGFYRSQFATGISNGGLTAFPGGDRWRWESRLFSGEYDDGPGPARPVYGAWNRRADPSAEPFGSGRRTFVFAPTLLSARHSASQTRPWSRWTSVTRLCCLTCVAWLMSPGSTTWTNASKRTFMDPCVSTQTWKPSSSIPASPAPTSRRQPSFSVARSSSIRDSEPLRTRSTRTTAARTSSNWLVRSGVV
jgi:hypothetical protein